MSEAAVLDDHPKLVTIDYFIKEMLGYSSRITYYNHLNDPGWPQRVYPGRKPMLVYSECVAYVNRKMKERAPTKALPKRRGRPPKSATDRA